MSASYFDLLKYAATGQASPDMTYYDKMRASTLMGGAVQTLTGQPPLTFKADGTPLISWSMKGNGSQTGTPTPDAPIMPTFCGVRTGNLFDKTATNTNNGYISDGYLKSDGSKNANVEYRASEYIAVSPNQSYVLRYGSSLNQPSVCFYDSSKNFISGIAYSSKWTVTFTTPQNAAFLRLSFREIDFDKVMLNTGSTALPYEPFGWAEKITCAGQTVPVYLGEVPTVRRIKKLVFDGTEEWFFSYGSFRLVLSGYLRERGWVPICSHYKGIDFVTGGDRLRNGEIAFLLTSSGNNFLYICDTSMSFDVDTLKAYLASEYAAGHPVTVWYVLATPETAIVNEPLCKIGDYADELHSEDAAVTIPTAKGQNVLTVDTPIQPSEMSITYRG